MIPLLSKKTQVIIDTNFLLLPGSKGIDVIREIGELLSEPHTLCVVKATEFELKQLIENAPSKKDRFNAKLGLIMIKQQGLKVIPRSLGDGYADQMILNHAKKGTIVATLDKGLRKEVLDMDGRIITIKNGRLALIQ
jgi:rRNA-processing protein FCF1